MDPIFLVLALERLVGFLGIAASKSNQDKFDLIIYDGISSEETVRIIGASSKARLYMKYLRNLAEKTDLGRLAAPSLLRLVDEAMKISSSRSYFNGRTSSEIWDTLDQLLEVRVNIVEYNHTFIPQCKPWRSILVMCCAERIFCVLKSTEI